MKQVVKDREFRRIQALPRKNESAVMQRFLFRGAELLRPIQTQALLEILYSQGGFLPIGVGYGKTLIALLAPRLVSAERPVLLVEAGLKKVIEQVEIPRWSKHFDLPEWHAIISYNDLSSPKKSTLLSELQPDLIVADEAHNLRHMSSTRVKRLARYFREFPSTKFVAMSGTMSAKSIKEFAHLAKWALKEISPVPQDFWTLENWSAALDSSPMVPQGPGVLLKLCEPLHTHENAREAFRCRLVSTPGVVATSESSLGTSLVLEARCPDVPESVMGALKRLRGVSETPEGELVDSLGYYRVAQQLSLGFYYRWAWPNGIKDTDWLTARRGWSSLLSKLVRYRAKEGRDSEALIKSAIDEGDLVLFERDFLAYQAWKQQFTKPEPATEAVWISDFIVEDVRRFVESGEQGIIWYRDTAVGERLAKDLQLPLFGDGASVELASTSAGINPYVVVSIKAHSQGQNLQSWNRNLVVGMCGGARFQQLLARTHRTGQEADTVTAEIYQHTLELENSFNRAVKDAQYIEQTTGERQRLTFATRVGFREED